MANLREIKDTITIVDEYKNNVKIEKVDGKFYICHKDVKHGPYVHVFVDRYEEYDNDYFIFGWNADKIEVYRDGLYGVELKDVIDNTNNLAQDIKKYVKPTNVYPKIKDCKFLEEVNLFNKVEDEKLGLRYIKSEKPTRYVYEDKEGQVFIFNPYSKKFGKKYDTFAELRLDADKKGYDYMTAGERHKSILYSRFLKGIKGKSSFNSRFITLKNDQLLEVINFIKAKFGVELLRSDTEVSIRDCYFFENVDVMDKCLDEKELDIIQVVQKWLKDFTWYSECAATAKSEEYEQFCKERANYYRIRLNLDDADLLWDELDENKHIDFGRKEKCYVFTVDNETYALVPKALKLGICRGAVSFVNFDEDVFQNLTSRALNKFANAKESVFASEKQKLDKELYEAKEMILYLLRDEDLTFIDLGNNKRHVDKIEEIYCKRVYSETLDKETEQIYEWSKKIWKHLSETARRNSTTGVQL